MEKSAASLLTFHFHAALRSIKLSHQDLRLLHLSALQITQAQREQRGRQLGRQLDSQGEGEGHNVGAVHQPRHHNMRYYNAICAGWLSTICATCWGTCCQAALSALSATLHTSSPLPYLHTASSSPPSLPCTVFSYRQAITLTITLTANLNLCLGQPQVSYVLHYMLDIYPVVGVCGVCWEWVKFL